MLQIMQLIFAFTMKKNVVPIHREESLKTSFNDFWRIKLGIDDLYQKMSVSDFVALKKALSDINNIITLRVTLKFIEMLRAHGILSHDDYLKAIEQVNGENPNSNGYDIKLEKQKIVAEIKCNIPVGEQSFGAAQISGIKKDIDGLWEPSHKSKDKANTKDYLKFMVLLDTNGVHESMAKIIRSYGNYIIFKEFPSDDSPLRKDVIYVCYISMS